MNPLLYKASDGEVSYADIRNTLKKVGVTPGDTLFIHSDISVFGKLQIFDRNTLLQSFIDAIKECVGPKGTIIMPTFTYSFCKNEVFDVQKSPSTVGTLTEFFRKQEDVKRTIHPMFSVAIWGNKTEELLDVGKDSFDTTSIFGKLHSLKGKLIFLGAAIQSCTYLHYIEQSHGVPYRYVKSFHGTIKDGNEEREDTYTFLVRDLDKNVELDTTRLEQTLLDNGCLKKESLGDNHILMIESDILFDQGSALLDKDIYYFLKQPAT